MSVRASRFSFFDTIKTASQHKSVQLHSNVNADSIVRVCFFSYHEMRTRSLKVIDMAVHDVATITADKNIQECAAQMRTEHVGSLVVINDERKPIGMITDRDIAIEVVARKLDPEKLTVKDVMTAPVVTATPNEGMVTALARMREFGIRRLPIVSEEGAIVGVISNSNLIEELSELLGGLVRNIHSSKTREVTLRS